MVVLVWGDGGHDGEVCRDRRIELEAEDEV